MRVVARDGEAVVDQSAALPGRGAWVHPTSECVSTAIQRKAFGRALKVEGVLDAEGLRLVIPPSTVPPGSPPLSEANRFRDSTKVERELMSDD
ncbi:hypothetical protein BH09ACT3_BH09ACT3_10160 [soil metagenome]